MVKRLFRAPLHAILDAGLVGGGRTPRPSEVSLAHNGVLLLDEFPEFRRNILYPLRQPLKDGHVTIARAAMSLTYPARFMLVAAMNPCPCGYTGSHHSACICAPQFAQRHRNRISGPILDGFDLHIEVPALTYQDLQSTRYAEPSSSIRERLVAARKLQFDRYAAAVYPIALMKAKHIRKHATLDTAGQALLEEAIHRLGLSARACNRILKVARTISDLDQQEQIAPHHLLEAIQYRTLDRTTF